MQNLTRLLTLIEKQIPELYAEIEKKTEYPDEDPYTDFKKYDEDVDKAELKALSQIIDGRVTEHD